MMHDQTKSRQDVLNEKRKRKSKEEKRLENAT